MNSDLLFSKTPPVRLFFTAAMPGAVSMLASALYQLFDGIFIGHFLGETAFAALNFSMPLVIINFALADLIGVGSSVPIAISLGKGEQKEADNLFTIACLLIVITGALTGALLFAAAPALIGLMGAKGEMARLAAQYLRVYALCSPVTTIIFAMDNYLRICGQIKGSMLLNIFMSAITAALEFTFLYVFGLGIWGAALATCTGMIVCAFIALIPFLRGRMTLHFVRPVLKPWMLRRIVSCGSPNFLNNLAGRITSILMNVLLLGYGGESAVSIYGILMYAEGFIQPLLYGMCDSLQPAVGYNWGAGAYARVRAIERCCFTASAILSALSLAVLCLFPAFITRLFLPNGDAAFMAESLTALRIFALTYLTRWFSFAAQSYMLAVGNALPASLLSVANALIFPVLLVVLLSPLGLTGLWLNFPGSSALTGVLALGVMLWFGRELARIQARAAKRTML